MIVLDTTVLVYAKGTDHPLREGCRRLIEAIGRRDVEATTSAEVIQEFAHVRARRRSRDDAASLALAYAELLAPLLVVRDEHLRLGLRLFERHVEIGAFDAVLAAVTLEAGADALVTADAAFGVVDGLSAIHPASLQFQTLFST